MFQNTFYISKSTFAMGYLIQHHINLTSVTRFWKQHNFFQKSPKSTNIGFYLKVMLFKITLKSPKSWVIFVEVFVIIFFQKSPNLVTLPFCIKCGIFSFQNIFQICSSGVSKKSKKSSGLKFRNFAEALRGSSTCQSIWREKGHARTSEAEA